VSSASNLSYTPSNFSKTISLALFTLRFVGAMIRPPFFFCKSSP
jgi:hypothetical protein